MLLLHPLLTEHVVFKAANPLLPSWRYIVASVFTQVLPTESCPVARAVEVHGKSVALMLRLPGGLGAVLIVGAGVVVVRELRWVRMGMVTKALMKCALPCSLMSRVLFITCMEPSSMSWLFISIRVMLGRMSLWSI